MPEEKNEIKINTDDTAASQLEISREILKTNREIAESVRYIRNHFRFELVMTAIKWFMFAALIVFGFISIGSIISGLQSFTPTGVQEIVK